MADRYTYVPLIGLFLMLGWGIPTLLAGWRYRETALRAASVVVIFACAAVSRSQVRYWESDLALWTHSLAVTRGNYMAHNNLGTTLANEGKLAEAFVHYVEAVRFKPDNADAYYNLGSILMGQGRPSEAMTYYAETLRLRPDHVQAHNNMGVLLKNQGRINEAISHYTAALRLQPDHAGAHYNLGDVLASQGKVNEAIAHYTAALRINPANQAIRSALEGLQSRPVKAGSVTP